MLWALMDARYKDGTPITDEEMANLMIALLMGGQHNTAVSERLLSQRLNVLTVSF
jgi:sterol 14-demethylase